jgi:hypothetical protein
MSGGGKLHTIGPQSAHMVIFWGDRHQAAGEASAIGGGTLNVIESGRLESLEKVLIRLIAAAGEHRPPATETMISIDRNNSGL